MSEIKISLKRVRVRAFEDHYVEVDGRLSDEEAIEVALRGEGEITSPYPRRFETKVLNGWYEDDE